MQDNSVDRLKRTVNHSQIRIGADIGGTFTDVVLDVHGEISSVKVLTDQLAPEKAVLRGIEEVARRGGIDLAAIDVVMHGTTLATNALIERRGAKTAFITTEGFRDVLEMRTENRFDQYDLNITFNPPLIPRQYRFPVQGRIDASGCELQPLDEKAVKQLALEIVKQKFESVAIGFIHSYVNPAHEQRARDLLQHIGLDVSISLSAEVAPQMREYPRFSTVCANAYVRPRIERYLTQLQKLLRTKGVTCPLFVIHSAGGLMSVEVAKEFPIRLVESGPAGGANFAATTSARFGLQKAISFDMGGTTAKLCLLKDSKPATNREFEIARSHRFRKGSGMPILVPVIEMIEIGAGGGSVAWVDVMERIQVGPESAGSEPGPACYQRDGRQATVTDADVVLGKIDPDNFAGGSITLSTLAAEMAIDHDIGKRLSLDTVTSAFGISEVVDENMANAARVHAAENGENVAEYVMIAFGGAAPLHAARICEKLEIKQCLIPSGAGVGSAIGFLQTPFSHETVVTHMMSLTSFDAKETNQLLTEMIDAGEQLVSAGTRAATTTQVTAYIRYQGQGWEIPVPLPNKTFDPQDATLITQRFEECYIKHFGRAIDVMDALEIEIVSWAVNIVEEKQFAERIPILAGMSHASPSTWRAVYDFEADDRKACKVIEREHLAVGAVVSGPAVIVEKETATFVTAKFDAVVQTDQAILLTARKYDGAQ